MPTLGLRVTGAVLFAPAPPARTQGIIYHGSVVSDAYRTIIEFDNLVRYDIDAIQ